MKVTASATRLTSARFPGAPSITLAEFETLRREVERQAAQAEAPLKLTPKQFRALLNMSMAAGVPRLPPSTLDLVLKEQRQKQQGES